MHGRADMATGGAWWFVCGWSLKVGIGVGWWWLVVVGWFVVVGGT